MNARDNDDGRASQGRARPADTQGNEEGRQFFERRMASGDENQWTRWHEEGRWSDARHQGRTWEARHPAETGPYAGLGPRGYQPSDERFRERICEALADDGFVDATDIEVQVDRGEVTLLGNVADRAQKRRAEEVVDRVAGVVDVHNHLRLAGAAGG